MTKHFHIEQELLTVLQSQRLTPFTIPALTRAYRSLPACPRPDPRAARQFVVRNVVRLERRGILRTVSDDTGKPSYQYIGTPEVPEASDADLSAVPADVMVRQLKDKLHQCRVELLTALGETEEYDVLCTEHPHLRTSVQPLYNEARDRSSKTLGRVRALESIIANHRITPS